MWFGKKGLTLLVAATGAYQLYRRTRKPEELLGFSSLTVSQESDRLILQGKTTLEKEMKLSVEGPSYATTWQGTASDGCLTAILPPAPSGAYRFILTRRKQSIRGSFRID